MDSFPELIMDHDYIDETFYFPFKVLKYMGQWLFESESLFKRFLYSLYRVLIFVFGWHVVSFGFMDLYVNWNDLRKVILNSCTTVFTLGVTLKNIYILSQCDRIERLRTGLFQDSQVQTDEEDVEILKKFNRRLKIAAMVFLTTYIVFYPSWLASSLMSLKWGPREMPFPIWLPVDLEDDLQFAMAFIYHTFAGTFILAEAASADLAMYSLILQTTGQFVILKKNVLKVNEIYSVGKRKEKNKYLLQLTLREKFKQFLKRQLELKHYVMEIENAYSKLMLLQFLGGLMVAIGNGVEIIVVLNTFSLKVLYQFAFFSIILSDLFICCALADSLIDEGTSITAALYSLEWYEMENDNMKDILLMIMGTQRMTQLTVGKLLPLNLRTYLGFIKNLYSWLALFHHVVTIK